MPGTLAWPGMAGTVTVATTGTAWAGGGFVCGDGVPHCISAHKKVTDYEASMNNDDAFILCRADIPEFISVMISVLFASTGVQRL